MTLAKTFTDFWETMSVSFHRAWVWQIFVESGQDGKYTWVVGWIKDFFASVYLVSYKDVYMLKDSSYPLTFLKITQEKSLFLGEFKHWVN